MMQPVRILQGAASSTAVHTSCRNAYVIHERWCTSHNFALSCQKNVAYRTCLGKTSGAGSNSPVQQVGTGGHSYTKLVHAHECITSAANAAAASAAQTRHPMCAATAPARGVEGTLTSPVKDGVDDVQFKDRLHAHPPSSSQHTLLNQQAVAHSCTSAAVQQVGIPTVPTQQELTESSATYDTTAVQHASMLQRHTTAAMSGTGKETLSDAATAASYRQGVGICVVNACGQVLSVQRSDDVDGTWQMPQGGIDSCEDALAAAFRELHEETGITNVQLLDTHEGWLAYEWPTRVACSITPGGWRRFDGQAQRWFLLKFTGQDDEIDLAAGAVDGAVPELKAWRWAELEDLPDGVVHFKRGVYQAVVKRFAPVVQRMREDGRM